MKILVTGAGGMLGSALVASGAVGYPRRFLDVTKPAVAAAVLTSDRLDFASLPQPAIFELYISQLSGSLR